MKRVLVMTGLLALSLNASAGVLKVGLVAAAATELPKAVSTVRQIAEDGKNSDFNDRIAALKEKAGATVRRMAVFINTNPVLGNPDIDEDLRDVLPHEAVKGLINSWRHRHRHRPDQSLDERKGIPFELEN